MKYYFLASFLPELNRDDIKIRLSLSDLLDERPNIAPDDWKEIELILLSRDILIIDRLLSGKTISIEHSIYGVEFWRDQVRTIKEGPEFILEFLRGVDLQNFGAGDVDRLYGIYYDHVLSTAKNGFLLGYVNFELNLRNIIAALRSRGQGFDPSLSLVGEGDLVDTLGVSTAEDFGLGGEYPWLDNIIKTEAPHQLQDFIEQILWEYIDENVGTDPFDFNVILAYLLRVDILQRKLALSEEQGMEKVRRLGGI